MTLSVPLVSALIGAVALLAGTVVGWALSHVSSVLARRVENRLQFNAVLAELLEIRHLLLVGSKTTDLLGTATRLLEPEQVQALGPVPPEVSAFMDQVIAQLVPGTAALEARYGDAVSAVARLDPALGHRLRDQDMLLRIALALTAMAKAAQAPADKVAASEDVIVQSLMPHRSEEPHV